MNATTSPKKKSPSSNRRRRGNESLTKTKEINTPESLRLLTWSPTNIANKSPVGPRCRAAQTGGASAPASRSLRSATIPKPARQEPRPTSLRQEFRAWRASLPTALERDTLLMPDVIAENVVQEVEGFFKADLPDNFAKRLAAKAHHLYPRHKHFH